MKRNNPVLRFWRALTSADRKEAEAADKTAYLAAHKANEMGLPCMAISETLGHAEFLKLIKGASPKDSDTLWTQGTDPALWGDVMLNKLREAYHHHIEHYARGLRNFQTQGGVILNAPNEVGARPADYIFNDVYQNISRKDLTEIDRRRLIGKLEVLVVLGIKFDLDAINGLIEKKILPYTFYQAAAKIKESGLAEVQKNFKAYATCPVSDLKRALGPQTHSPHSAIALSA